MDETAFLDNRRKDWERLDSIVRRAVQSSAGVKRLSREEVREFGPLYRRVAADLAYSRTQGASENLAGYLNDLVAAAHALLYATDRRSWHGLARFFAAELPRTFRRRLPFFWAALALTLGGAVLSYGMVMVSKENVDFIVPHDHMLRSSLDAWVSGQTTRNASDPESVVYATGLMVNNIQVSFNAFALGVLGGFLTAYVLFFNGMILGAFAATVTHAGTQHAFWLGVLPHGVVEISEILIAGAAGLTLGWAVLAPGRSRRRDALAEAARDSVRLVLGGVILLVFAGLTEGFVSHSTLPAPVKLAIALLSGVALYVYLFGAGRTASTEADVSSDRDTAQ